MCGACYGIGWTANNYIELLYGITLKAADLANGDSLTFRVLRSIAANMTYTVTPTINVIVPPPPVITQAAYQFFDDAGLSRAPLLSLLRTLPSLATSPMAMASG